MTLLGVAPGRGAWDQNKDRQGSAVQFEAAHKRLCISKFYLHREARGSGTGRVCMEFIEQLARRREAVVLLLTVNKGNPAVNAYERLGFRIKATSSCHRQWLRNGQLSHGEAADLSRRPEAINQRR